MESLQKEYKIIRLLFFILLLLENYAHCLFKINHLLIYILVLKGIYRRIAMYFFGRIKWHMM